VGLVRERLGDGEYPEGSKRRKMLCNLDESEVRCPFDVLMQLEESLGAADRDDVKGHYSQLKNTLRQIVSRYFSKLQRYSINTDSAWHDSKKVAVTPVVPDVLKTTGRGITVRKENDL